MYNYTAGTYKSSDKLHDIHYAVLTPRVAPFAVLQLSHGMCEFFERYTEFAEWLCERGIVVCGNDHLGHGQSCAPDEYGYFGEKDGDARFADDVEALRVIMRKRYRSLPYFLLGHSMGSFIARDYIEKYPGEIDGTILSGTSGGDVPLGFAIFLADIIAGLRGSKYRSKWLRGIAMGSYNKRFGAEKDVTAWLSKNTDNRAKYAADPRCSFIFTARGYGDMFRLLKRVSREEWAMNVPKGLPILIASGCEDPVGNYGKGVGLVCDRLQDAEIYDLTLKMYPNMRHEILNETERETVYADIFEWIKRVSEGVIADRTGTPVYFTCEEL